jgi:hypothetical protein
LVFERATAMAFSTSKPPFVRSSAPAGAVHVVVSTPGVRPKAERAGSLQSEQTNSRHEPE